MKLRSFAGGVVLGVVAALVSSQALSQESNGNGSDGRTPEMPLPSPEEMQAMMKAWEEAMTPGPQHKALMRHVGMWDTVTRIWMAGPNAPPTEIKGSAEFKSVLGGRFVQETTNNNFPVPDMKTGGVTMTPVEGMGLFGFDNYQKVYIGCWADSMGTQLLTMRGNFSQDGNTLTMYGQMDEPMLGVKGRLVKYVTQFVSDDEQLFTVYDLHAGDDYKAFEVTYTRRQ